MTNLNNCLSGIEINEKGFLYFKSQLLNNYSFDLVKDLLSLPCMRYETEHKIRLLLSLLEDKVVNDTIIEILCQLLSDIPGVLWRNTKERVVSFIEKDYHLLSRAQLLRLAHTIELMYAKGYDDTFKLCRLIYERIPLSDVEFNPDSEENARIRLAKLAYATNKYNFNEVFGAIKMVKSKIKNSERYYLLSVLDYYKGICLGHLKYRNEFKDASYYMLKSKNRGFYLASVYLTYSINNFETSKDD